MANALNTSKQIMEKEVTCDGDYDTKKGREWIYYYASACS